MGHFTDKKDKAQKKHTEKPLSGLLPPLDNRSHFIHDPSFNRSLEGYYRTGSPVISDNGSLLKLHSAYTRFFSKLVVNNTI